jgi:hypothetical protein
MRKVHQYALLLSFAAPGLWLAHDWLTPRKAASSALRDQSSQSSRLQAKVARLEELVERLQRTPHSPAEASPSPGDVAPNGTTGVPEPGPAVPVPMNAADVQSALQAAHHSQRRDPKWSNETETQLRNVFGGTTFPGTSLVEADCRTTFCRAVVDGKDDSSLETFRETMTHTAPFATEGFVTNAGAEGAPRVIVYFAREGESLQGVMQEI